MYGNTASGSQGVNWQISSNDYRALVQDSCVQNYTDTPDLLDFGFISSDPLFVNAGSDNYRLDGCDSPCINGADELWAVSDTWDAAQDGTGASTLSKTPDLDLGIRFIGDVPGSMLDMGCYEVGHFESCLGDVAPSPCPDGVVDINDYTAVVLSWASPCNPIENCSGDADGDGDVDIDDYTAVILGWGPCEGEFAGGGGESEEMTPEAALQLFLENNWLPEHIIAALIEAGYIE